MAVRSYLARRRPQPTLCSRRSAHVLQTYDVSLDADCARYRDTMLAHPAMIDWIEQAHAESDQVEELDAEF